MKKVYYIIFSIIAILFYSCEKNENIQLKNIPSDKTADVIEKSKVIQSYAKVLAVSLKSQELREIVKNEALKKFDGDYDILAKTLEEQYLDERQMNVKQLFAEKSGFMNDLYSEPKSDGETFLSNVREHIPNLQVAVPVNIEEWETGNYIPLVAYLPYDYDEKTVKEVFAYDSDGNTFTLNPDIEPEVPVIVVSPSERVDRNGNFIGKSDEYYFINPNDKVDFPVCSNSGKGVLAAPSAPASLTLSHGTARSLILQWPDVADETSYEIRRMIQGESSFKTIATTEENENIYVNTGLTAGIKVHYCVRAHNESGYSASSPIMSTTASGRNDNEWLRIKQMKFSESALKAVEKWLSGAPEIRLRVVQGSEKGASNIFTSGILEPGKRKYINDRWWVHEVYIVSWSTNAYGTVLNFDWRESDWDDNVTFNISGSYEDKGDGGTIKAGGSVEIKNSGDADVIGNTSVMWWHPKSQVYNLSGFQWQFVY